MNESKKIDGVCYAMTLDGIELPVIDVTHSAFTVDDSPEAVKALRAAYLETEKRWLLKLVMRFMMRRSLKKSLLLRSLSEPGSTFLSGMSTYVMKLGPRALVPPFNSELDCRIAGSPPVTSMRIRLQQTARLLADGLESHLISMPRRPLHLLNIGGGPAIDSVNALLILKQREPKLLQRKIVIHVLDPDDAGPLFGERALNALKQAGSPLAGVDVEMKHTVYDWNNTATLEQLVRELTTQEVIFAASSEGALFEYPDDQTVIANLKALRAERASITVVVGSVTRADEILRRMSTHSVIKLVQRGAEKFEPLAKAAGFEMSYLETALMSDQVVLQPLRGKY